MTNITKPIGKRNRLVSKEEAKAMLERVEVVKNLDEKVEESNVIIGRNYEIVEGENYASALLKLIQKINFPDYPKHLIHYEDATYGKALTIKQIIEERINDFETLLNKDGSKRTIKQRLQLFNLDFSSCSGIAYKKGEYKAKIIPCCKELVQIDKNRNNKYVEIDYDKIHGFEINISDTSSVNIYLTKDEIKRNLGWQAIFDYEWRLLEKYFDIVSQQDSPEITYLDLLNSIMAICTYDPNHEILSKSDILIPLSLYNIDSKSVLYGKKTLDKKTRFLISQND